MFCLAFPPSVSSMQFCWNWQLDTCWCWSSEITVLNTYGCFKSRTLIILRESSSLLTCIQFKLEDLDTSYYILRNSSVSHAGWVFVRQWSVIVSFLVWDRLYTHSCVSGGGSRRWCMLFVLRIVNETSTWHNPPQQTCPVSGCEQLYGIVRPHKCTLS